MSQIKDVNTAKAGLSGLFGVKSTEGSISKIENKEVTKEEVIGSLSEETREALQKEVERRKYLKAGRPPKGAEERESYTRMTFIVSPEKQTKLREIALKEGLFIKEVLEKGIDMIIAKYETEGKI